MEKLNSINKKNIKKLSEEELVYQMLSPHTNGAYLELLKAEYKNRKATAQDTCLELDDATIKIPATFKEEN